jgi:molecular chaperone Hsp33
VVHVVSAAAAPDTLRTDFCQSFVLAGGAFRGRFVRLSASISEILTRHRDPEAVSKLLCEAMTAAAALASTIKYDGVFTLQAQGKGAVHTLVADITSAGNLRGCAKFDAEKLAEAIGEGATDNLAAHLLGAGHLAFTVDQGPDTERYQGIVELVGGNIADSVHNYFRQSEQLASALMIAIAPPEPDLPIWRSAAMVIQRMPDVGGRPVMTDEDADDAWRTAVILMGSATKRELIAADLPAETLLHRLFATIGVGPLGVKPVLFGCRCSRQRSGRILASFPTEEVKSYATDGVVRMTCEFCCTDYDFPVGDIESLATTLATETTD